MLARLWRWLRGLTVAPIKLPLPSPMAYLPADDQPAESRVSAPPEPEPEPVPPEPVPAPQPVDESTKRKYDSSYIHLRRDLAGLANGLLDRFENLYKHRSEYKYEYVKMLGDLWGCDFLVLDRDIGERMKGGDKWSAVDALENAKELTDIMWPIDYAVAIEMDEHGDGVQLYRIRTVEPENVRGQVTRVAPKMVRYVLGTFYDNGHWKVIQGIAGLINNKWVLIHTGSDDWSVEHKKNRTLWIAKIMSSAFSAHYEWHVAFGTIPGGPRMLFPTNPPGCLQLFKNRAVAPGKNRRDSLKHWVSESYRDTGNDIAYVANHLRGHTAFDWAGFNCELFVSAHDLEKNEFFRKQANEWRAQRKHNRVRVHLKRASHARQEEPHP